MPVAPVAPVDPVEPVEPVLPWLPWVPVAPAGPAGPGVTTTGAGGMIFTGLSHAASIKDVAKAEMSKRWFMVIPMIWRSSAIHWLVLQRDVEYAVGEFTLRASML